MQVDRKAGEMENHSTEVSRTDENIPVLIVGAGPVGLALALGLARLGVRSVVLERKASTSIRSKAPAIHIRTREIFRTWGVEESMLSEGVLREVLTLHDATHPERKILAVDFTTLREEAERPGLLILEQGQTERLLLEAVQASGMCEVHFNREVIGLEQDSEGVSLQVRAVSEVENAEQDEGTKATEIGMRGRYVVGCDGARSCVRRALGLSFEGLTYSIRPMLADVRVEDERDDLPWPRLYNGASGFTAGLRLRPGHWRLIRLEPTDPAKPDDVPESEIQSRSEEVLGKGAVEAIWASRFRIHLRHAKQFRIGRVLLAGDAAHIHSPAGGLGMNAGIHDAHNLAWKLAYALAGGDAERLLASYDVERRAASVESVSSYADTMTRLFLLSPRPLRALAFVGARLAMALAPLRRNALRRGTMIGIDYPESPLLNKQSSGAGSRLPNVEVCDDRRNMLRLYDLLGYRASLISIGSVDATEIQRVQNVQELNHVHFGAHGYTEIHGRISKLVEGIGWILVRPDGYIAWIQRSQTLNWGQVWAGLGRRLTVGSEDAREHQTPTAQ